MVAGAMAQSAAAATPFLDDWSTLSGRSFAGTAAVISRASGETEAFVAGVDSTVARIIMTKCQIHPNSSGNGIYLRGPRRYSSSPGFDRLFPGQQQVALHRSPFVHTKAYFEAVNARMLQAVRGAGCNSAEARSELRGHEGNAAEWRRDPDAMTEATR
jgi:hypothetical protein